MTPDYVVTVTGMDQSGPGDVLRSSESSLVSRGSDLAEADAQLAAILTQAHTVVADALQRLAAIEAEIESAVQHQDALALDTPAGAQSFHRFLLAKQQEIQTVVADANDEDVASRARLESILPQYLIAP